MQDDELIEAMARAIDPQAWADDLPIPTRAHTIAFHEGRMKSVAQARSALAAYRTTRPALSEDDAELVVKIRGRIHDAPLETEYLIDKLAARIEALSRENAEARRQALEEAAKVATNFLVGDPKNGVPLRNPMSHEIADAIRNLIGEKVG